MSKKTDLSDEERALFRCAVQHVKPLEFEERCPRTEKKMQMQDTGYRHFQHDSFDDLKQTSMTLSSYIREPIAPETVLSFYRLGVNKKILQQLKSGQYPIDAILDLHGQSPDQAESVLSAFILKHYQQHSRHILLIHGKGGQRSEPPVIKNLVNCWLPQFPQVLAFHSALPKQGGTGALYVLLKKLRE